MLLYYVLLNVLPIVTRVSLNRVTILSSMSDAEVKLDVCYALACIDITQLTSSEARDVLQECIQVSAA